MQEYSDKKYIKNTCTHLYNSSTAGEDATKKKLIDFAKDAGYDITLEEIRIYFKTLNENNAGELSDAELDMVVGGKDSSTARIREIQA